LSTKGLHRKAAAAADAVALKQNEEKKRLCEKLQEVEHLSLSSVFVLKSLHLCQLESVQHNTCSDVFSYASCILHTILNFLGEQSHQIKECNVIFILNILNSFASSLCIIDERGQMPFRLAWNIMPRILKIWEHLNSRTSNDESLVNGSICGRWIVRAVAPEGSNYEAYSLNIEKGLEDVNKSYSVRGNGTGEAGKSKGGSVTIFGLVKIKFLYLYQGIRNR